jgi:hypothetical protein
MTMAHLISETLSLKHLYITISWQIVLQTQNIFIFKYTYEQ